MATENKCPHCGKPVPTTALAGICPECMLKAGAMETGEVGPGGTVVDKPPRQPVPRVDEIAPHFPQLEILECLGRGGMGTVYKARQPKLDRLVALKILTRTRDSSITDPEFTARFQQEARALARLNHPDIVAVYDFGEAGGCHYLLMEYVDGLTLRQLLQTKKLSPEEALAVVPKICEALQFAHERGIVHRDIKPENILLDKQGRVKIADFGIAKILGTEAAGSNLTGARDRLGTPHYMAPEQVEKPATVDHRADIYSLGVVFYEMLTGELPLGKFQSPSRMVRVDVRLDEVVLHALEKNPDRRYQHASEVKTDVETIATTPGSAGVPPAETAVAPGLSKQEAEKLGRDIGAMLNKQGLRWFARKCLLWFADQALLLFDFTAWVPLVVERAGRRCFNFWPFLLLFCSTIGFLVNGGILAILFVQRWWHGHPFDFSIQEVQMFIWMVITGVGRLAALKLGSNDEAADGRAQPARSITARRVGVVFRRLLKLAALMLVGCLVGSFFGSWVVGLSPTEITSTGRVLWWIPIFVAVGLIMAVGWWFIGVFIRVRREMNRIAGESIPGSSRSGEAHSTKSEIEQGLLTPAATREQKRSRWRRAAVTALAVFTTVFGMLAIITALLPRAYEAKAKIIVRDEKLNSVRSDGELDWALRDVIWSFRGPILQDQVATELDLHKRWAGRFRTPDLKEDEVRELLAKQLVIERIPQTATFEVSCFSTRPDEAAEIANKAAEIFCASPAGAKASLIERATPPRHHARPNARLNLAFAAALGLVLGIVFGAGVLLVAALRPAAFESAPPLKPTSTASVQPRSATIARWSARILGTLWVLIFLAYLMGEGSPPFGQQPAAVQLEFVAMALMFAGCLAGWWRDLPAVLLTLGGWMLFHAAEQHLRAFSIFHVPLLTGVLFSVSWNARYPARRAKLVNWIAPIAIPLFVALLATGATKSKPVPTPAATNVVTAKSISAVSVPPVVTATFPPSGAAEIDPALNEIRVTFSKPMQDGNWSWNQWSDESFPQMTGEPKYLDDHRTCVLPVRLMPGNVYAIWLNSEQRNNFKDREGRAALPYLLIFETRN